MKAGDKSRSNSMRADRVSQGSCAESIRKHYDSSMNVNHLRRTAGDLR
jgi:hypothetical protein